MSEDFQFAEKVKIMTDPYGQFGCSVCISDDGNAAIMGADGVNSNSGSIYIFS